MWRSCRVGVYMQSLYIIIMPPTLVWEVPRPQEVLPLVELHKTDVLNNGTVGHQCSPVVQVRRYVYIMCGDVGST